MQALGMVGWASFSDSKITAHENMTDMAVIENHDKIMISNILACRKTARRRMRHGRGGSITIAIALTVALFM